MTVQIFADIVCPWCYIGALRFTRSLRSFAGAADVVLSYLPFQLDSTASSTPEPLEASLRRKYGRHAPEMMRDATKAAHEEGVVFRLEKAVSVNTLDAHRLLQFVLDAYGPPVQVDLMDRLYRAYFEEGLVLNDIDTLGSLAADVGVDSDEVHVFLASDEGEDDIRRWAEIARERGVTAVPTFVFEDTYALQGAQPPAVFLQALNQLASEDAMKDAVRP
jgi:predicted DsbA family dithiol-disulfide isomerase